MDVPISEAKQRLSQFIRAVEGGENVVITRHGRPVAQITVPPPERSAIQRRPIQWGAMRDRVKFLPGWDDPITIDELLGADE